MSQFANGTMARQFRMHAHAIHDGEISATFFVINEVKQGCVLGPTLFSIVMLSAMFIAAFSESDPCIGITYRIGQSLQCTTHSDLHQDPR